MTAETETAMPRRYTNHRFVVRRTVVDEVIVEIYSSDTEPSDDLRKTAIELAFSRHERNVLSDDAIISEVTSSPLNLIQHEEEYQDDSGRWFCEVYGTETPDGTHRRALVYEIAGDFGRFRTRINESVGGREAWVGGKILWDSDTSDFNQAKEIAREFVRMDGRW